MQQTVLSPHQIDFIVRDLAYRGIVMDGVDSELVDHICSATEEGMRNGVRFSNAYEKAVQSFGSIEGLYALQRKTLNYSSDKPIVMVKSHFKIAWRSLLKQRVYSLINLIGLATSLSACLIIALFVANELSYDKHHANAERIFRLNAEGSIAGNDFKTLFRSAPEAALLEENFPEIEATVRFINFSPYFVKTESDAQSLKENRVIWADSTFFRVFSVNVLEGNAATALAEPGGIAISRRTAERYFGMSNVLGKSLILDDRYNGKITAVYEDFPSASHFHFDIIVSLASDWPAARHSRTTDLSKEDFTTYILLKPGVNPATLQGKLSDFVATYLGPHLAAAADQPDMVSFREKGNAYRLLMMPLRDIHLHSSLPGEFEPNGSIIYVYLLISAAAFILIIACINFMNLSTARSGSRAKEVGIMKVMGSFRTLIIRQFLLEALIITSVSVVLALLIAYLFLPMFNQLSNRELAIPYSEPLFYMVLLLITGVATLLAGFYPAVLMSAFKPADVLKSYHNVSVRGKSVRSVLVVFQFCISVVFIVAALVVNRQLHYIQNKTLGFNKEQVVIIHDTYALRPGNVTAFKIEAGKIPGVLSGTVSGHIPVAHGHSKDTYWLSATTHRVTSQHWVIDSDYLETMGMQLLAGRDFSPDFPSDTEAVILNEKAVERLGLVDPIGQQIGSYDREKRSDEPDRWTIVGVVKDFHFASMKEEIVPVAFQLGMSDGAISFRFDPGRSTEILEQIEILWKKMAPGDPFQYSFLNADFEQMYAYEQRLSRIFNAIAVLTIVIAALGLFALTAFTAQQRTREIGIRKVFGASTKNIFYLLTREFGKLILIAFCLSIPLSWLAVDWWLSSYSYRTDVGVPIYASAAICTFSISLLTMSVQVIKAASTSPVNSLRNE